MNEKKQTMILLTTLFLMVSMLILYPVLKISLNNNNEDKIKNNVINIISEVNNYYKENTIFNEEYQVFTIMNYNIVEEGLVINEKLPEDGYIYINKEGKVQIVANDGEYCIIKKYNDEDITITNDKKCKIINSVKLGNINIAVSDDNNDGLYKVNDYYVYRGYDPNNYIEINNILFRIVKIDNSKNITIISNNKLIDKSWDTINNNYSLTRESNIGYYLNNNEDLKSLRTYENFVENEYYSYMYEDHNFDNNENYFQFGSVVSLININDYINASLDTSCKKNSFRNDLCGNGNWLKTDYDYFSIDKSSDSVYSISSDGKIYESETNIELGIRPIFTLKSNLVFYGDGTKENPYKIKEK